MKIFKNKHKPYITKEGYIQIYVPKNPEARENGYAPKHRVNAAKKLGRALNPDEVVHHIDGNKKNNKKGNLQVLTRPEHSAIHSKDKNKKKSQ